MEYTVIQKIAIWALPVLFAITLHEVAHGWVASKFGDQTARLAGRLTIDPLKHIDLMGTIVIPLMMLTFGGFIFGWAKPVPVDPRNMRHPRYNMAVVAAAGPVSNLLMAVFWAGIAKIGLNSGAWFSVALFEMGKAGMIINIVLCVLNCLPIPPLDGGRVLCNLLPGRMAWSVSRVEPYGFLILILLMLSGILSYVISPIFELLMNGLFMMFNIR